MSAYKGTEYHPMLVMDADEAKYCRKKGKWEIPGIRDETSTNNTFSVSDRSNALRTLSAIALRKRYEKEESEHTDRFRLGKLQFLTFRFTVQCWKCVPTRGRVAQYINQWLLLYCDFTDNVGYGSISDIVYAVITLNYAGLHNVWLGIWKFST